MSTSIHLEGRLGRVTYQIDGIVDKPPYRKDKLLLSIDNDAPCCITADHPAEFRLLAAMLVQAADFIENK